MRRASSSRNYQYNPSELAHLLGAARQLASVHAGKSDVDEHHLRYVLASEPTLREKIIHDGRFATLSDVVDHYNAHLGLTRSEPERNDLVEYLKSIPGADTSNAGSRSR